MLPEMPQRFEKPRKGSRPPRIRVPNNENALFTVNASKFVGVLRRLSLSGGSVVFSRRPVPKGTLAEMELKTVFGKVTAHIEFLHTGADGTPHAQAFRFLEMDDRSWKRYSAAAAQMQRAGFSDAEDKAGPLADLASQSWAMLRTLVVASGSRTRQKG
jgi:hypothetical protein